jgi:D-alanyl-lipoteichoic acid acyltransferase DltB (MBOAT superfamily)
MLFNSIDFAIFLPVVFILYWFVFNTNLKLQNFFVIFASYFFYGWWDWKFLGLILLSTIVDFTIGQALEKAKRLSHRKRLLWTSILVNLGILGFFKYFNFFIENFVEVFRLFGMELNSSTLNIILPVGISFYTFQTLSYTIDVYRRKLNATNDFVSFAAFVSFFPQLVAGPIERATHLLPQFYLNRKFDYAKAVDGMRQILWGLFKKMVIADNCAEYANLMFDNPNEYNGISLLLGAVFFAFQIYGDFSGYSDIAIGISRLFGFDLRQNFAFPYFSRDIAEFWRRWHISLSTWFRDYLYIPLGGSRKGQLINIRNVFIIFIVSGFWHGANWTFIVWGALNAIFFIPLLTMQRNRRHLDVVAQNNKLPSVREIINMLATFLLVTFGWIFFRSESIAGAMEYLGGIFSTTLFDLPNFKGRAGAIATLLLLIFFVIIEWKGRRGLYGIEKLFLNRNRALRWSFYIFIVFLLGMFAKTDETPFIYFQF